MVECNCSVRSCTWLVVTSSCCKAFWCAELAAFVSGTQIRMQPVARAARSALDTKAVLVQSVTFKLFGNTCLFSKGGQGALTAVQHFVTKQQEVQSFSLKPLSCFSASVSAFSPVLDLGISSWNHRTNSKCRLMTAGCCIARRPSHQNCNFI